MTSPDKCNSTPYSFNISGLTRKQRQVVQKVIEQSKKDADLASPTSSTTDENEQYKRITFLKKPREEGSSSGEIICHKKKRSRKDPVISDQSSDSEDSVVKDFISSNHGNDKRDKPCSSQSNIREYNTQQENFDNEIIQSKDSDEEPSYNTQETNAVGSNVSNEEVGNDKGKKPSEILGNIFGTPNKMIISPNKILTGSPCSNIVNSPISIFSISDDSNDDNGVDKHSSKRTRRVSEGYYVPLLDQLQQRMDPLMSSSMSLLQTSIDLSDDNKTSLPITPSEPFKGYFNSDVFSDTSGSTNNGGRDLNLRKQDSKKSTNIESVEKEIINPNPNSNVLTGIPSSSTLKLDAGKNKRTYMKGVENIRNTLAMKRMLMNPDVTDSDKRKKENSLEHPSNTYSETIVSETIIDQSDINKETNEPSKIVSETFQRSLSDSGNLHRVRQIISTINISGNKSDTDKDRLNLNVDFEKDVAHKLTSPLSIPKNTESNFLHQSPTNTSNNEDILFGSLSSDFLPEKNNVNKLSIPKSNKTVDSRGTHPKYINNNALKNVSHKRTQLPKSLSSPAVPNALKISRSEKLLNAMKSANTTKRPEKSKKLSLKEYNAKKAYKQNILPSVPPIIEFTKIPILQTNSATNNVQKVANNSVDKVTIIPPPIKPVIDRRVSLEKKEKAPKPIQIATNTDVLGNIMECFKQPNGRDSTKKVDIEQVCVYIF